MTINKELAISIRDKAQQVSKNETSRREAIIDKDVVSITSDCEVSRVLLNHCVSKQTIAGFCGIPPQAYVELEKKAIAEGKMEPAIKLNGRWQYTPSHIHAMLDYSGRKKWSDHSKTVVVNVQNQKGGTGKSTATMTVATSLATDHHNRMRVCVIDLDPQGSLRTFIDAAAVSQRDEEFDMLTTVDLMLGEIEGCGLYQEFVDRGMTHKEIVKESLLEAHLPNLKILPAFPSDERFSSVAWQQGLAKGDKSCLKLLKERVIDVIRDDFDVIFIDTGPQVNPLTWNALYASGALIIPVTPHKLDWQSTLQFYQSLPDQLGTLPDGAEGIAFYRFLITNKDAENNRDEEIVDAIKHEMGPLVMNSHILKTAAFEAAARNYRTVCDIRKLDKLCPTLQLDRAQGSVSAVSSELKGLLKDHM